MVARKKGDRVTIRNVAEDAGVSVAAVSKVLRDAYGVSESLRGRVQASMAKLGYRPHAAARGMRGQTYTLGVILSDIRNQFFADILAGINVALERTQYQPLLGISQSAMVIEQVLVDAMIDRQMDGLILVAPRMRQADVIALADRVPTVVIGHHLQHDHGGPPVNFDTVNDDDAQGAALIVRHLVEGGYRKIAYLTIPLDPAYGFMVTSQREAGYRATMADLGLARHVNVVYAEQTPRETQTAVRQLLQSRRRPEAIFCWTDFIAFEVISVARELGLSIPDDLAVIGYDNTSHCDLFQNALTSVDQSGQQLGLQSARLLIERIKGRDTAEHLVFPPRLVVRGSSAKRRTEE